MSARITLRDVRVVYPLLTVEEYNLKRRVLTGIGRTRTEAHKSELVALDSISLALEPGTRLGIVGANGAGKSTLLRVLAGALPPTSGRVEIQGEVFSLLGGSGAGLDFSLTGLENVMLAGIMLGQSPKAMSARVAEIADFSGLGDRLKNPVSTYSSGMQARLRFSIVTSLRPEILVMDEGVATADAAFTMKAQRRFAEFRDSAEILVVSSHGPQVAEFCETAMWLESGRIRALGPVQDVLKGYFGEAIGLTDYGAGSQDLDA